MTEAENPFFFFYTAILHAFDYILLQVFLHIQPSGGLSISLGKNFVKLLEVKTRARSLFPSSHDVWGSAAGMMKAHQWQSDC